MPAGRPTKYNDEMLIDAQAYLEHCPNEVPTAEGMAIYLKVATSTLYKWAETHEEFSDTLRQVQECQKAQLVDGGLNGTFNATIAKLMLANHGYHDKSDNTHSGPDGGPVQVEQWTVLPVRATNTDS